jgi:hypothetical protein
MAKLRLRSVHTFWGVLVSLCGATTPSYAQVDTLPAEGKIVDCFEPLAFTLARKKPQASLPAALHGKGITGFAAVEVAITPDGAHRLVRVLKLKVTEPGQATLSVDLLDYQAKAVPYTVQSLPYYPMLVEYVQHDVSFRPTHQGPVRPITYMSFLIRFK